MRTRPTAAGFALISLASSCAFALAVACSSQAPAPAPAPKPPPGFVPSDAQPEAMTTTNNCVAPGTASNANGVGGYCSPGGGECAEAGPDGGIALCTADLNAPANAWFCTLFCASTAACGPGATCVTAIQGQACVPSACLDVAGEIIPDAGDGGDLDAAMDAADDASDAETIDAGDDAPDDGS
jgi:hypothetical protein